MDYLKLEAVLKAEYGCRVSIVKVSPLHDEDFEPAYMVCVDDVIICRADIPLKKICEALDD